MRDFDLNGPVPELPPELIAALKVAGFSKVASAMTGAACDSEADIYAKIGSAFFARRKEAALIRRGLESLRLLEKSE